MLLNLRIKYRKIMLAICAKRYGINGYMTQKESEKLDKLINEYYKKHR